MNQVTTSERRVLDMLRGTELSQREIIKRSGMTERAVRYILNDLLNSDLISIRRYSKDRRMKLYTQVSDIVG